MKITVFKDGWQDTVPAGNITEWNDLVDRLTVVECGNKNGSYFVRGECSPLRSDENMISSELIIIDGDSMQGDGSSCCPVSVAIKILKKHNITNVCYNSYSNDLTNNKYKWRAVIPCGDIVDKSTLSQGVTEIVSLFHAEGVKISNVKENSVLSQPWFFPRCPVGLEDDFEASYHDGVTYSLTGKILASAAKDSAVAQPGKDHACFSWRYVNDLFLSGTLHQGLKSAIGWLVFSTTWSDSQIKQMMLAMIQICPDKEKVERAGKEEIDSLVRYCRKKAGVTTQTEQSNWKDDLINGDQLKDKEFPDIVWAVEHIIPEGLTIFAGDAKIGKSLLALDLCLAVSAGVDAIGQQPSVQGDVVYMSMEDPQRRVKERIKKQHDIWPATFHLVTSGITTLGIEFYKTVDEMMLIWPDLRMIVIDTLQFVMPPKKNNVDDYSHYYQHLDPLHKWSLENHVAIICITHKNKTKQVEGDNPFAGIIGSVAIQGTADAMLMLSKNSLKKQNDNSGEYVADGFLSVIGREIEESCYALEFDADATKWNLHSTITGSEFTGNKNWSTILEILKNSNVGKTPIEIHRDSGIKVSTVKTNLSRMKKKGLVFNVSGLWSTRQGCVEIAFEGL